MKVSFDWELQIILKNRKVGFVSKNATMIQIQDMFENGKQDIVVKTVKGFNIKNSFYNFNSRKYLFGNCCPRHVQ